MEPDEKLREMQDYMCALYIQQKEKGGIIDPDAADSKVLLVNEPVRSFPSIPFLHAFFFF